MSRPGVDAIHGADAALGVGSRVNLLLQARTVSP